MIERNDMPKLINLETGEVQNVDTYAVREWGMPDGFQFVDELTDDDWIEALQNAKEK